MADFEVNFNLNDEEPIEGNFELTDTDNINCLFRIDAVTYEYGALANKPQINGVTLIDNKTSADLGLQPAGDYATNTDLQNEATTRANSDTLLQNGINTLTTNLNAEIVNRTTADTTLSNEISQEASNREDADEDLQEQITANHNNFANYRTSANQDIIDNDIKNSIKNGKLTIQANGTNVATFTANQSSDVTANIQIPDSATWGNITGTLSNQTDLQTALNSKQNTISNLSTIESNALAGKNASDTIASYGNIVTHNTSEFATSSQGALADSALQPNDDITELNNNAGYITSDYHDATKQDKLTAGANITIENNVISASGQVATTWGDIVGTLSNQTDLQNALNDKQPTGDYATNTQLTDAISTHNTSTDAHEDIREKIKDIELFKFPNAVIIGTPTIQSGQVSNFTTDNYMQFPFVVDVRDKSFEIDFCFTTGSNVTTQQNIMDSKYGLALAIANGKGLMAMSSNGTQWDIGSTSGTYTISANTTYYAKVTWDGTTYATALSTDGTSYTTDMTLSSTKGLYPTTIYIGGGSSTGLGRTPNPFNGSINFNKCYLYVAGLLVWQGMDDAGLATRADVSLSNLDSVGEAKITYTGTGDITVNNNNISFNNSTGYITSAYHDSTKQDTLVSGTNIKTINSESILGSGDIEIKANPDNETISLNSSEELQAIGVIDANNSSIALKTWTGTKAEYEAITTKDSNTNYTLTDTGEIYNGTTLIANAGLNKQQLSNCILNDPQNIKLELSDGTLTLKAGSVVCVPNGFESDGTTPKFDEVIIESDISASSLGSVTQSGTFLFFTPSSSFQPIEPSSVFSGSTTPTVTASYNMWYDTSTNLVKMTSNTGSTWTPGFSFPICIFTRASGVPTSIDQIFQSIGYIGSTVFVRKGLKVLIPNGRNDDGSLKNIEYTSSSVKTQTLAFGAQDYYISLNANGTPIFTAKSVTFYKEYKNLTLDTVTNLYMSWGFVGTCSGNSNNVISNFNPYTTVNILTYDTGVKKTGDTMTGDLIIQQSSADANVIQLKNGISANKYSNITITNSNADISSTPTTQEDYVNLVSYDKNGYEVSNFLTKHTTSDVVTSLMRAAKVVNGTRVSKEISVGVDANGKAVYSPVQLITTYVSGTSGYNIWSNGYCEQWGTVVNSSDAAIKVSLLKTMANTNYVVSGSCKVKDSSYTSYAFSFASHNYNTTYFYGGLHDDASYNKGTFTWIVFGYLASGQY